MGADWNENNLQSEPDAQIGFDNKELFSQDKADDFQKTEKTSQALPNSTVLSLLLKKWLYRLLFYK